MSDIRLTEFRGQPALHLRAPDGAQATVLLLGGQLVSWVPAGGEEQLYLSPTARYGVGASVRGGVPAAGTCPFNSSNRCMSATVFSSCATRSFASVSDLSRAIASSSIDFDRDAASVAAPAGGTPEAFGQFMATEQANYAKIVKATGVKED